MRSPGSLAAARATSAKFSGSSPVQSARGGATLVAVSERGLVTVVAVGDVEGLQFEGGAERLDGARVVDLAERVALAVVADELGDRLWRTRGARARLRWHYRGRGR